MKWARFLISFIGVVALSQALSSGAEAKSDPGQLICAKDGNIFIRKKCKAGETELTPDNFASVLNLPAPKCVPGDKGDPGISGVAGVKGNAGVNGISPSGAIPSGKTITGAFKKSYIIECEDTAQPSQLVVTFPVKAPLTLTPGNVSISKVGHSVGVCNGNISNCMAQPSTVSTCTGSVSNPTAPRGVVCIYFSDLSDSDVSLLSTVPFDKYGFGINWKHDVGTSNVNVEGQWAYTAP